MLAQELVLGQQTNIHRCTMEFYKKVEMFVVRGPGSNPKPFSILIKLGMCIAISSSCIVVIAWRGTRAGFWEADKYTSMYNGFL